MTDIGLLTLVLLTPLAGALVVALLRNGSPAVIKSAGLGFSTLAFLESLVLWIRFDDTSAGMQFVEQYLWIPQLDISYHLGIDGISLLLVVLTTLLTPIALLASWDSIQKRLKGFVGISINSQKT